jgi:GrpB-like predicted nucleotidyltransferase (UPF0157 family)
VWSGSAQEVERYPGPIVVQSYDASWPEKFEAERQRLQNALGTTVIDIEHVGSTAVPGLAAKPIIDIVVLVHSPGSIRNKLIHTFGALGYALVAHAESWLPDELLFRQVVGRHWTHHAHVMAPASPRWEEFILVRDYLRRHDAVALAYGSLKQSLALVYGDDIAGFRRAKAPFLTTLLSRARAEGGSPQPGIVGPKR